MLFNCFDWKKCWGTGKCKTFANDDNAKVNTQYMNIQMRNHTINSRWI